MGGTHSGNPLCCAAAMANIDFLNNEHFQEQLCHRVGIFEKRMKLLEKFKCIDYVNARGMVGALLFNERKEADEAVIDMVYNGIMPVHTWSKSIKIGPPLVTPVDVLEEVFDTIEAVLERIDNK